MAPYIWMLCGALSFAFMGEFAHALGKTCDWQLVAIARTSVAMVLAAGLAISGRAKLVFFHPRTLWVRSIAGSISLVCGFYAMTHMPVTDVLTVTNMFPLWVGLLSWPLLGEPPPAMIWGAALCGIVGVGLTQGMHFGEGNLPTLAALLASLTSAVALIGLHRLQGIDSRSIVAHFSAVSLIFSLGAMAVFGHSPAPLATVDGRALALMGGVGLTATIGQILLTKAFAAAHPAKVSVVALSQVVFSMGLDILLWNEQFSLLKVIGILLILLPSAAILLGREA